MGGILPIESDISEGEGIWGPSPCLCLALVTLSQQQRMWHLEEQERSPKWGQDMTQACSNITKVERDQAGFSSASDVLGSSGTT